MIAEIKNKWQNEDLLTGHFFGNLRYLPFNKGLGFLLKNCIREKQIDDILDRLKNVDEWENNIEFWKKIRKKEPDIFLIFEKESVALIIEVKYWSGLSSAEDSANSKSDTDLIERTNQLIEYGNLLIEKARDKQKILILLAQKNIYDYIDARSIYIDTCEVDKASSKKRIFSNEVMLRYMTWQDIYDVLEKQYNNENSFWDKYQKVIISDLLELMLKKGFAGFRGFEINGLSVEKNDELWSFCDYEFSFIFNEKINGGLYYE